MKTMKLTLVSMAIMFAAAFASCDKVNDATKVNIDLGSKEVVIAATVDNQVAPSRTRSGADTRAVRMDYEFKGEKVITLAEALSVYLDQKDKIDELKATGISVLATLQEETEAINPAITFTITVEGVGSYTKPSSVDIGALTEAPAELTALINNAYTYLQKHGSVKFSVNGFTNVELEKVITFKIQIEELIASGNIIKL